MRASTALILAAGLAGCGQGPAPPPRKAGPPDLVLLVLDGASPADPALASWPGARLAAWSTSDDPALAHRHLLTGTFRGERPNTIPQVLGLYGYRAAAWTAPGFLAPADEAWMVTFPQRTAEGCPGLDAPLAWLESQEDPAFLLLHRPAGCATTAADVARLAALPASAWIVGAGARTPGDLRDASSAVPLLATLPAGAAAPDAPLATPLDLLPTLLGLAGAIPPSDARGLDLRGAAAADRQAIFQVAADGRIALRTTRHRLVARPADDASIPLDPAAADLYDLQADPAETADLLGPTAPPEAAALQQALAAFAASLTATTARGQLGGDEFTRILQDGGYWEAKPPPGEEEPE